MDKETLSFLAAIEERMRETTSHMIESMEQIREMRRRGEARKELNGGALILLKAETILDEAEKDLNLVVTEIIDE